MKSGRIRYFIFVFCILALDFSSQAGGRRHNQHGSFGWHESRNRATFWMRQTPIGNAYYQMAADQKWGPVHFADPMSESNQRDLILPEHPELVWEKPGYRQDNLRWVHFTKFFNDSTEGSLHMIFHSYFIPSWGDYLSWVFVQGYAEVEVQRMFEGLEIPRDKIPYFLETDQYAFFRATTHWHQLHYIDQSKLTDQDRALYQDLDNHDFAQDARFVFREDPNFPVDPYDPANNGQPDPDHPEEDARDLDLQILGESYGKASKMSVNQFYNDWSGPPQNFLASVEARRRDLNFPVIKVDDFVKKIVDDPDMPESLKKAYVDGAKQLHDMLDGAINEAIQEFRSH